MAFPTTRWTLLAEATLHGDAAGREALRRLCEMYRQPVIVYLGARGFGREEAQDLAQDFFLKLVESHVWKRADHARDASALSCSRS
jgi:DNA-directed RNA polymerase specialized sigma24 family protein